MSNLTVKIIPEGSSNSINFSKNYRIFTLEDPIEDVTSIYEILEDIDLGSAVESNLKRSMRYSKDKVNWSLWYDFDLVDVSPGDTGLSDIYDINFNKDNNLYLEFKYEYDDGTTASLSESITVNEIKIRVRVDVPSLSLSTLSPAVKCSNERCPLIVANRDASFNPYDVDPAVGMYKDLSFYVNQIYGHQVVYFKAEPDQESGDYVFKEWVLYNVEDIKCIKVLVENNEFPDNQPLFTEEGLDYEEPFEIHIDKLYFESIFGTTTEPRKKDFMYFPLLNRMFEIKGSYVYRGVMMEPVYHKIQLMKFRPNINYNISEETQEKLNDILLDSEELFEEEVQDDIKDAVMPQQHKSITEYSDEVRAGINSNLGIRPLDFYFNYASLIENYYDLTTVVEGEFAVDYNDKPILDDDNANMTFSTLFNIRSENDSLMFINGKDDQVSPVTDDGLKITGRYVSSTNKLSVMVDINGTVKMVNVSDIDLSNWYALVVTISKEFGQLGVFVYDIKEDTMDTQNHNDFIPKISKIMAIDDTLEFDVDDSYKLYGTDLYMANIRLFKRVLKQEDHMFILSQLFIKDESMLYFIDNNRPKLDVPYLSRNR